MKYTLEIISAFWSKSPGQSAVNARSSVVEIVSSTAVEGVFEEVLQNVQLTLLHTPVGGLHHVLDVAHLGTPGDGFYDLHYGIENPGNLARGISCVV